MREKRLHHEAVEEWLSEEEFAEARALAKGRL
jgi:hypothetical protein